MRECSNVSIKFSVNVEVKQVCESAILIHFYSLSAIWETYLSKSYKLKVERIRSSVIVKFTKLPTHGLYFYEVSRGYKKILVAWNGLITKELSKWGLAAKVTVGGTSGGWRFKWGFAVQVPVGSASGGLRCFHLIPKDMRQYQIFFRGGYSRESDFTIKSNHRYNIMRNTFIHVSLLANFCSQSQQLWCNSILYWIKLDWITI